jgi:dGTPase
MSAEVPGYSERDVERFVAEPVKRQSRTAFARDRARVLHSAGLRRLAAKTQVHSAGEADFPRTRLTHTLEVAQIARELGDSLGCDPDVVDVAGLAHDLGHPPFGHNGEDALDALAGEIGGFEGNAQSLRVLTRLEAKVTDPVTGRSAGLNLTRASLDAVCKYPWQRRPGSRKFNVYADDLPIFTWLRADSPGERRALETQVMDWADDVAYSVHDVEDAIHSGHVDLRVFDSLDERAAVLATAQRYYAKDTDLADLEHAWVRLTGLPWWMSAYDGSLASLAHLKHLASELIGRFCSSAEVATRVEFGSGPLTRYAADLVVPDEVRAEVAVLKAVAMHYVMQRPGADEIYQRQRDIITDVVHALVLAGGRGIEPWLADAYAAAPDDGARLRVIIDQVASLTDVSIVDWHTRLVR